jgi:HD-GYP domain-containing protein (c-di-GMP phosphodiesterase class II)
MDDHDLMVNKLNRLIEVARGLSMVQQVPRLLEQILLGAKELTHAEGGTLYQVVPGRGLVFSIVINDKLGLRCGGEFPACSFPDVPLFLADGMPNLGNVCAYTAFRRQTVNLADAYQSEGFDFSGTKAADTRLNYRSKSFLTLPLVNHRHECMAVLQLINRLDEQGQPTAFSPDDVLIGEAMAAQASIALENQQLLSDYRNMFEAVIQVLADAVDQRSPHTGRHSRRVPLLAVEIGKAVNRNDKGPLAGTRISEDELEALRMGSLLHDVGKIAIPDRLLDKRTRLWMTGDGIELIRLRMRCLIAEQAGLKPAEGQPSVQQLEEEMAFLDRLDEQMTVVTPEDAKRLADIATHRTYTWNGGQEPVVHVAEAHALSTPAGTLTPEEKNELSQHPMRSFALLQRIPFPGALAKIPEIARNHHEWCNGKGYPLRLQKKDLDVLSRIVPLADVFEALTAPDRPYRKPATVSQAEAVMTQMGQEGHLDPDLVQIFIEQRVGYLYGQSQLESWQLA